MEKILILDFGGCYSRLIALRTRENDVFSEILPHNISAEEIKSGGYKGIVLTGPSGELPDFPDFDRKIFDLSIPVLGIDFGARFMASLFGGELKAEGVICGSYNYAIDPGSPLFSSLPSKASFFMDISSHISTPPIDFKTTAKSAVCAVAAMENPAKKLYAVQFHPEKTSEPQGNAVIKNFLFNVCGCHREWTTTSFILKSVKALREKIDGAKVLCALSGGVKSAAAAMLLHRAIGDKLTCVFIDHGFHRPGEAEYVKELFAEGFGMKLIFVDAKDKFEGQLRGISGAAQKAQIVEKEFNRIFEAELSKLPGIKYFVNGAVYTDILDPALPINSYGSAEVIEPLRSLFKSEVRKIGLELGLPEEVIKRQHFPKTGLLTRISGGVTAQKLKILGTADAIFREHAAKAGVIKKLDRCFATLSDTPDSEAYTVILRACVTDDFMTARPARLPYEVYEAAAAEIMAKIRNIDRVLFDITTSDYDTE